MSYIIRTAAVFLIISLFNTEEIQAGIIKTNKQTSAQVSTEISAQASTEASTGKIINKKTDAPYISNTTNPDDKKKADTPENTGCADMSDNQEKKKRHIPFGYDGGMMLHTGYLTGTLREIGHKASRMPFGIGGAIKFHIGKYFRIGSEGYVSTMNQLNNGSTIKFGWGGVLADFRFFVGQFMPYAGVTIGGGSRTCTLMIEGDKQDWEKEENVIFNKKPFFAVTPFIGTDIVITKKFHLTVKLDYLFGINRGELLMPTGPKLYFGFLMYH